MTLHEVAAELTARIERITAEIEEIKADIFDELYLGKQFAMEDEVAYLTKLRDKILGE